MKPESGERTIADLHAAPPEILAEYGEVVKAK